MAPGGTAAAAATSSSATTDSNNHGGFRMALPRLLSPRNGGRTRDALPAHQSSQHRRRHSFHHVKDSCSTKKKEDGRSPRGTAGGSNNSNKKAAGDKNDKKAKTNSPKDSTHFKWILWASFILTINAGFINTITLHTLHAMPSAHVTGIVARASNFVANGEGWNFLQYMVSYVCFVVGACTGGCLINYETFYLGRIYGRALFILAAIQGLALIIENSYENSIIFVWMATYSCGLQNSMTSKYSGNAVRTTHLTGASTDLGIALGHILKGRTEEWWKVQMHGIAVVGFFIGGVLGFFAFEKFEHAALLVNVCLTTCCAVIHVLYVAYHERMPVISVLESRSDIRIHKHRRQLSDPQHSRTLPRSPRLRSTKKLDVISPPLRLNMTSGGDLPLSSPSDSLSSTAPSTALTGGPHTTTPLTGSTGARATVVATGIAAAEDTRMAEQAVGDVEGAAGEGEGEEELDNDDVWGHTPASSVHGLDDDDNEIEPTPEENPYPLFETGDIAGLPQEESEVGSIVEGGRVFPRDEEEGGAAVSTDGCLPRPFSPTGSGRIWSPRSLRRHRQQQEEQQQQEEGQQGQEQALPGREDAEEDEGKS